MQNEGVGRSHLAQKKILTGEDSARETAGALIPWKGLVVKMRQVPISRSQGSAQPGDATAG